MVKAYVHLMGTLGLIASLNTAAQAAAIVDFKPLPASPTSAFPEFVFSGTTPSFSAGAGSIGNADGVLPVVSQTPGGLLVETPFIIGAVAGSQFTATSTLFFDCTLTFTGLTASAPAINAGGGVYSQPLSAGTFTLTSTDPDGAGPLTASTLLTGTMSGSSFIVGTGNVAGEFNASSVNYTSGLIYNALLSSGGAVNGNSMSISMVDVTPSLSIASSGYLSNFAANGTGLFNATVPEPTTAGLLVATITTISARRRGSARAR